MVRVIFCGTEDNKDIINEFKVKSEYDIVAFINEEDDIYRKGTFVNKEYKGIALHLYDKIYPCLYTFIEMQSRFSFRPLNDYVHDFNKFFDYFADMLISNNVEIVVFLAYPHTGSDYILYKLARELNIKTVICFQSSQPDKFFCIKTMEDFGKFEDCIDITEYKHLSIENTFEKYHWYAHGIPKMLLRPFSLFKLLKRFINKRSPEHTIKEFANRRYLANLKKIIDFNVDYNQKYVYFPLHVQPELTTCPWGGKYSDQMLALEWLRKLLPDDWYIYIKENSDQDSSYRGDGFFERLSALKNIKMVPIETPTVKLIESAVFIATVSGTVGWEAISGEKNALVFGQAWYESFPGVFKFSLNLTLDEILNYKINHQELEEKYSTLMSKCGNGVIYKAYKVIVNDFDEYQNLKKLVNNIDYIIKHETKNLDNSAEVFV